MAKVVKLNLKDIENIVKKTINEAEFDDLDTKVQPEELPSADSYDDEEKLKRTVAIGKGDDGKIYVTDVETGEILGTK
jgi:hypothetical protein